MNYASTTISPSRLFQPRRLPGIRHYVALLRQRRALARLDDRALADIGLTRAEAWSEADRPLWDVPAHWLR
ncbi:DUF1127 domain-containing protein [Pelagovum pacificum]|uniref:DUF1127 domain-containing protein n=1 Tax=Pelagovum pacificum TaxID=2588711 RepID=A0A5C5G9X9_9RHOB|nr:DUF1127 domain-containing protein [Pelagovum pacificum]QQA41555.1 DUF1127 domain-containing protein [Pelagovum pacificum]TNY30835.1 DUF1127 domain-containing protein [Pelagovum pacificum]